MTDIDVVERFKKLWDLANEVAEKETIERFRNRPSINQIVEFRPQHKGDLPIVKRIRRSRGDFKIERLNKHIVEMIEMFMVQYPVKD